MAPDEERRGYPESGKGDFEGRDLLVGRPEGAAAGRPTAGAGKTSPAASSPQPGAHDDAIREILETVRATAARIDALQDAPGPEQETAEALARETAALTQAVEDARGALAKAAELAARRDGTAEATRVLAEGAAALRAQGEALDKSLHATGRLAEATARQAKENGWQAEVAAQGIAEMNRTARVEAHGMTAATFRHLASRNLDPQLHTHAVIANMTRGRDGGWRSAELTSVERSKLLIGAYYRNELRTRLEEIGYATVPTLVGRMPGMTRGRDGGAPSWNARSC